MNKNSKTEKKPFNMTDFYYPVDYHIGEEENVFNNPEKFGFVSVAVVRGNGTEVTTMQKEAVDYFILGYTGLPREGMVDDKIDRTIVHIPNEENLVVLYNKYFEEREVQRKQEVLAENNYVLMPTIHIDEIGLNLYSTCVVCRLADDGSVKSIVADDYAKFKQYLSRE